MRLLLVEDTADVADAIAATFRRRGDAVDHAATLSAARDHLSVQDYDVIVLDIHLPDGEGTALLSELRASGRAVPVLVLTARFEVESRVAALDGGADDYLVKPFDLRELDARVRALARRGSAEALREVIRFGDLTYDRAGRALSVGGDAVALTRREISLLEMLLTHRGRVLSKERIHAHMFSFDEEETGLNAVEIQIGRLRRKLAGSRTEVRTLRGLGYQLIDHG